jgi:hypothetical protein
MADMEREFIFADQSLKQMKAKSLCRCVHDKA